jgi:heme oxygenase
LNDQLLPTIGLSALLRARTANAHARAERSGVVAAILAGTVTRPRYALWLRNLLPVYQELEQAAARHRARPGFAWMADGRLHRAGRIAADLAALIGLDDLPVLPAGRDYAQRVKAAGSGAGDRLLAHAYTRYLGDLSGGQVIRRHLLRRFGPEFRAVAFTEFPAIPRVGSFVADLRTALDDAGRHVAHPEQAIEEAVLAFELNIALSEAVAAFG